MHGIKVLMAKNYIDNLSEEARKGQQEKAEQGIWPTKTPLGYLNVTGPDGRKVIAVDPEVAPIVFEVVRMVCGRAILAERGSEESPCRWTSLQEERRAGAHQHGAFDPSQPALYRPVRVER